MTKYCGIYKIKNIITGDFYIGSSNNIQKRLSAHRQMFVHCRHDNCHLQRAYNKYGADNFEFSTVLLCDIENKLYYEQTLIDGLKPTYNIATCAEASQQGLHHTDESRQKMSAAHLGKNKGALNPNFGKPCSEETRRKLSEANKGELNHMFGKHWSEEAKRKNSEAHTGKPGHKHTEAELEKMSNSMKGKNKGKVRSAEVLANMSVARKGKNNPNFGKPMSEEQKRKLSEAAKRYYAEKKATKEQ